MHQDAQGLIKCAEEFEKTYSDLLKAYKSDWQDDVHDSYGDYVKTVRNSAENLTEIAKKTEKICDDFNSLQISSTIDESKRLCDEAMHLCDLAVEE